MSNKRLCLFFSSVVILFFALSFSSCWANGFSGEGSGTSGDPYIITTAAQLDEMRNLSDDVYYFKLGADIDLDVAPYNTGEGWVPIGDG
jgi:hypothetical protein